MIRSFTLVSHEDIGWFLDNVSEDVLVIIDEAYIDFVKDPDYKNAASYAISRPNVVVSRTLVLFHRVVSGHKCAFIKAIGDRWLIRVFRYAVPAPRPRA